MNKSILILSIVVILMISGCAGTEINQPNYIEGGQIIIAVGIVPLATFVEEVAGEHAKVVTLVPPGYSPTNYQPTSSEMQALSNASIYFSMQMPTEEANILPKASDFNKDIIIVKLRDIVNTVFPVRTMTDHVHEEEDEAGTDETMVDPHLWLSPKRSMVMVQTIADELSKIDEQNRQTYQENAKRYIREIELLDNEIKEKTSEFQSNSFMIYHGAYGYFADDYGLEMISIEAQGKKATASEIQEVIEHARELDIHAIYYQAEFDDNQAQTIAKEIDGIVIQVTPLTYDYIQGLRDFITSLEKQVNTSE
ncbi:MAG: zinc ABC transporter substrate-binding protein [Clostridiales bacterium]|nr:zinc ABC transporter substrate-binding protein [Clostridiales bacterium]